MPHEGLAHLCVHLFVLTQLSSGVKASSLLLPRRLHLWLRDLCPFVTLLSSAAWLGIFFSLRCLLFFRGISDFHDGGRLVNCRGGEGWLWREPGPGQVEPAAQTAFIMVCRARRLVKAMQADRGINHASSGQGGEPRLGINFVLDGAQVVGWEGRPPFFSSPSALFFASPFCWPYSLQAVTCLP